MKAIVGALFGLVLFLIVGLSVQREPQSAPEPPKPQPTHSSAPKSGPEPRKPQSAHSSTPKSAPEPPKPQTTHFSVSVWIRPEGQIPMTATDDAARGRDFLSRCTPWTKQV